MKRATECGDVWATAEEISIHALVKRATILQIADELKKLISIHALVKRATVCNGNIFVCSGFQSTPS